MQLSNDVLATLGLIQTADGQTDPDTAVVDMAGWDGVRFICVLGVITGAGTVSMQVKGSATDAVGAALAGAVALATATAQGGSLLIVDVFKPIHRYMSATITRAVANSVLGGVVIERYRGVKKPITEEAASQIVAGVSVVSPALA